MILTNPASFGISCAAIESVCRLDKIHTGFSLSTSVCCFEFLGLVVRVDVFFFFVLGGFLALMGWGRGW